MADAAPTAPSGTSSTPPAPPEPSAPVTAAPTTDATPPTSPTSDAQPTRSDAAPAPAAPEGPAPTEPLFTLPEDMKLPQAATQKFEGFVRGKLGKDGKVTLTSQELLDHYAEQARDASALWQKQITDTNQANEAACKARFTPAQLSAAETAVGFAASIDPKFREFAKRQLNDPVFVNFMREIGERLSEDVFEPAGAPQPTAGKKSREERMGYAKPKPN